MNMNTPIPKMTKIQEHFEDSNLELNLTKDADGHYLDEVARYAWMNWMAAYSFGREHQANIANKAIEIALAEQQAQKALESLPENLILPESKAALGDWIDSEQETCIKQAQPEPVDLQHKQTFITQNELKTLLLYSEETGQFTWRVCSGSKKQGAVAGTLTEKGYVRIKLKGMKYYAHRLAWMYAYGSFPINEIDHVNHCRADNRLSNLREASRMQNTSNTLQNTSGCVGVHWDNAKQKWRARIQKEGNSICLGTFSDIQDAVNARKQAEDTYYGHNSYPLGNTPATDNHAALRAEYAKQVKEGTTGFYLWEFQSDGFPKQTPTHYAPEFRAHAKYFCTDISCMVAKQGEPAKRMLRTEAQALQRSLGDAVEWLTPYKSNLKGRKVFAFCEQGTYTYAPKALKQVSWSDMPVGVMTNKGELREVFMATYGDNRQQATVEVAMPTASSQKSPRHFYCTDLTLAPASEQPWIAVQRNEDGVAIREKAVTTGLCIELHHTREKYKITGIAKGYVLGGAV
jgi:HNH endonuclease